MDSLYLYILKSSGLITVFFIAYQVLLRKETFFKSNRWFLLFGLVTSVVLPLITFEKIVWIEPSPMTNQWQNVGQILPNQPETFEINWLMVLSCIYGIGLLVFLFQLVFDFKHLRTLLKGKTIQQHHDFKLIDVNEKVAPFSYFNYIVYNSTLFNEVELNNILAHEKVHCEQRHSIDVLISRLFCIVFWYNPIIWLYQKAMLQNLEFIADSVALENISDKKSYQITLLKVTTQQSCVAITNPFYQSLIKKRIVMLNTNQSKKWNSWKYFIVIPALAAFLLYFQVKVIAQEKQNPNAKLQELTQETIAVLIDKNSTDAQMKSDVEKLKKEHNIKLKFSKIKRNSAGEIVAIKVEYKDVNGAKGITQFNGNEPIQPIRFYKSDDGNIGFGTSQKNMEYAYNFTTDSDENAQVITIISDEDDAEAPDAPEVPEAAELPETPESPEAVEVPELPILPRKPGCQEKRVIIKKDGNGKNKIQIVVNGEVMDIDGDKIIAELEPMINSSLYSFDEFRNDLDFKEIGKIKKKAMQEARITMKRVRPEMERAKREMELSRPEMEQARKEMQEAKEELRQARLEIEKSKAELDKLRAESKKAKK